MWTQGMLYTLSRNLLRTNRSAAGAEFDRVLQFYYNYALCEGQGKPAAVSFITVLRSPVEAQFCEGKCTISVTTLAPRVAA